ncbi:hypothetical protein INT45_003990 [Circinella minor]|uniref:F-box domain-containing protein n=1 Tax=Circinella minor TaxID=1195481 RepID=A0A8H7RSN3_9FUNG|nr:hypothetical protein INT45_003990 [Circinella minor]
MALIYAKDMIRLDTMYMDGYYRKASVYFGLKRFQDCISVCDGKDKKEHRSSNNNNIILRTDDFTNHPQLVQLRRMALKNLLDQGGFKIDFIGSKNSALPQELIDMIFELIDFSSFVTCTRISSTWCDILTNQVWSSILPKFKTDALTHLTEDEIGLLLASLRGEERFSLITSDEDESREQARLRMLAHIGDCNIYSLDIGGGFNDLFFRIILSNTYTLREITISSAVLTLSVSLILSTLVHSQVTALSFTGPYEVVDDLESPSIPVLNSLLHLQISDFHTQPYCDRNRIPLFMISTIRFFLKKCPNLQTLIIRPLENKRSFTRLVLREIERLRHDKLVTLQFYTED